MATSKLDITSDEIINIKCCVCLAKNRTREADRYCVECKDYYCSPCSEEHKNFPALRSHKLLDKADFRSQGPDGSLPSFVTQRCSQHQSEVVNMFCKDHNDVVCATCVALNHRSCTKIHYIPEDINKLYNKTELTNMKQKINKTKKTIEDIKIAKENEVKELKEVYNKEVQSVKAFRKELETLLANTEQETITKLKQEYDRIESRLISEIKEVNKLIGAINEVSSQLKKSEGNSTQEFVCLVSTTEAVVTLYKSVQFVSLGNKLTASRTLKINHYCYGLVHHNGKLYISDRGKNVYIHDMNGLELKRVSTDTAGKKIFHSNRHLTISADGNRVFVADCNKGVIILDIQGNYLSTLTDPTLSGCQAVCTDGRHLFVCGWYSGNIVQIGQDYKVLGELGKISCPYCLCFDINKNRLIVTKNSNNNIIVFE